MSQNTILNQEQISNFEHFIKDTKTEYSFCNYQAISVVI